jgi:AAA+ superfamily predicted ATPase
MAWVAARLDVPEIGGQHRSSGFGSSWEHLLAELERLDLVLRHQVEVVRRRAGPGAEPHDPLSGYYIPEAEVDDLLAGPHGVLSVATAPLPASDVAADAIAARAAQGSRNGVRLRLLDLATAFGLERPDLDAVVACLAVELDRRYERLYGYLHDDVTRRLPSVGLVLALSGGDLAARIAGRARFTPSAPLVRHAVLGFDVPPDRPPISLLDTAIRLSPRIVGFLLEDDEPDEALAGIVDRVSPPAVVDALDGLTDDGTAARIAALAEQCGGCVAVHLQGPRGVGKRAVALEVSRLLGRPLLVVRSAILAAGPTDRRQDLLRLVTREARLQGALVYWDDVDALVADDREPNLGTFLTELEADGGVAILAGHSPWPAREPAGRPFLRVTLPVPVAAQRRALWARALATGPGAPHPDQLDHSDRFDHPDQFDHAGQPDQSGQLDQSDQPDHSGQPDIEVLASTFRFTAGQIEDVVATARTLALHRDPHRPTVRHDDVTTASRLRAQRGLAGVGRRVHSEYQWDDLILPQERKDQLREIADLVRQRGRVREEWGFARTAPAGGGVNVLFSGPPGTGKTMAASVLANTLGVDLYAIDLASTVSKYIGETEKNLAQVFDEAAASNAILFFDEADALFGKRTQVRDAHDRYANLETSYLLQKLEDHSGVVVLATNLRKNMDDAFVRRIQTTVEFPAPGVPERLRIWHGVWPAAAPLAADVDLAALARQVDLPGGYLRNIAVGAAFLAAATGEAITMAHLVRATRAEYQKLGKILSDGELLSVAGAGEVGNDD